MPKLFRFGTNRTGPFLRSVVACHCVCRKLIFDTIGTIATSTIPAPTRAFYLLIPMIPFCEEVRRIGETVETGTEDSDLLVRRLNTGYYQRSVGFIVTCR